MKIHFRSYTYVTVDDICDSIYMCRGRRRHTCEPPDGRINSPVFLGCLPISNILPNSPDFYMLCKIEKVPRGIRGEKSSNYYPTSTLGDKLSTCSGTWVVVKSKTSYMCSLHHVHLGQQSKMQLELIEQRTCVFFNPLHSAEVVDSHYKICLTTLYTHPGLIILHLVGHYLNIC